MTVEFLLTIYKDSLTMIEQFIQNDQLFGEKGLHSVR